MELTPWLLWLSLTISIIYFLRIVRERSSSDGKLPPGPTPLPIVGSLFKLGDKPHRSLASLAKIHGPVMSLKLGRITTIVISSPDAARETLQKKDQFLSTRFVPNSIRVLGHHQVSVVWMPPAQPWKNIRTIIKTHLFNPKRLDANQVLQWQKIQELIAHVRERMGRTVDIGRAAFSTVLNLISATFFSVDLVNLNSNSAQEFKDLVWGILEEVGSSDVSDFFPVLEPIDPHGHRRRVTAHMKKLYDIFDQMIDRRLLAMAQEENSNSTTSRDLLDELLRLQLQENDFKLDRRIIKSLLADIFIAGSDTSSNTVEWAMAELLRNPSLMARARAELAAAIGPGKEVEELDISQLLFLQAVVKETLRLHPPVPFLFHSAETSVELGGFNVPKHSRVLVNVWALGRDGDVWEDPEAFSPERFLKSDVDFRGRHFELIPFGSGRRICPGLPLAHRMVQLMLASLIHSFEWKLPEEMEPRDVDLTEKFGVTLAMAVPLPAIALAVKD